MQKTQTLSKFASNIYEAQKHVSLPLSILFLQWSKCSHVYPLKSRIPTVIRQWAKLLFVTICWLLFSVYDRLTAWLLVRGKRRCQARASTCIPFSHPFTHFVHLGDDRMSLSEHSLHCPPSVYSQLGLAPCSFLSSFHSFCSSFHSDCLTLPWAFL